MRTLHKLGYLVPVALLACGSSGPTTVVVTASDFSAEEGKTFHLSVVDVSGNSIVQKQTATVTGGKISITTMVTPETNFRVDGYTDTDSNSKCEFGVDQVFSAKVDALAEGKSKTATFTDSTTTSDGCLSFGGGTVKLAATGFEANKVFKAWLLRKSDNKKLGLRTGTTGNGAFDVSFPGGAVGETFYRIDMYIDSNGNDKCDTTGDLVFRADTGALSPTGDGLTSATDTALTLSLTVTAAGTQTTAACTTFAAN